MRINKKKIDIDFSLNKTLSRKINDNFSSICELLQRMSETNAHNNNRQ